MTLQIESIKALEITPKQEVKQRFIDNKKRQIVVDWLFEVSQELKLYDDTIHYAVSYMDRFLMKKEENINDFQLLACTCLWIAIKFNESYYATSSDMAFYCDGLYNEKRFIEKECEVLQVLNFEISKPTIKTFLMHNSSKEVNKQADLSLMYLETITFSQKAENILKKRKRYREPSKKLKAIRSKYAH